MKLSIRKLQTLVREFHLNMDFPASAVDGLNAEPTTAEAGRIGRLIAVLQQADSLGKELVRREPALLRELNALADDWEMKMRSGHRLVGASPFEKYGLGQHRFADETSRKLYKECTRLTTEANRMLARYRLTPTVLLTFRGVTSFVQWGSDISMWEAWENYCAAEMLPFQRAGMLVRFRRCRECGKWLFAYLERQHFCSDKCRQRYASHATEFKQKRRNYMRGYREREKERAKRAREFVRGDRRGK